MAVSVSATAVCFIDGTYYQVGDTFEMGKKDAAQAVQDGWARLAAKPTASRLSKEVSRAADKMMRTNRSRQSAVTK